MLIALAIRDFAIVAGAEVTFGPGLNVLTGETGAGKSILIDALGAVLGDRTSPEMVRTGAKSATIDATFDIAQARNRDSIVAALESLGIDADDNELILSREIQSGGRSSARLNGRPVTAASLTLIGSLLVDVHGQSDHLSLLKPAAQLGLLDRYARLGEARQSYADTYAELRQARSALTRESSGARERMQRIDLLRYQIDEIGQAALIEGEEAALLAERSRLANAERLIRDAALAYASLAGGEDEDQTVGAMPALRDAARMLADIQTLDPQVTALLERLNESLYQIEDLVVEVRAYRDEIEADPQRLEQVEERLALLKQLQRKYGADVAEVLSFASKAQVELEALSGEDHDVEALTLREHDLASLAGQQAQALSVARKEAGIAISREVEEEIAHLRMGSAKFAVGIEHRDDEHGIPMGNGRVLAADETGVDKVTFLIAPNRGEVLKPLSRIASGGETARLMLALKSLLSDVDQTPTLVFDEIDVGVGGRSGLVVGEKLRVLANTHQVIVITHLPQIAAFANEHFRIAKVAEGDRVVSTINALDHAEREDELAAMLDGTPVTASSLQTARDMLQRASGPT